MFIFIVKQTKHILLKEVEKNLSRPKNQALTTLVDLQTSKETLPSQSFVQLEHILREPQSQVDPSVKGGAEHAHSHPIQDESNQSGIGYPGNTFGAAILILIGGTHGFSSRSHDSLRG